MSTRPPDDSEKGHQRMDALFFSKERRSGPLTQFFLQLVSTALQSYILISISTLNVKIVLLFEEKVVDEARKRSYNIALQIKHALYLQVFLS